MNREVLFRGKHIHVRPENKHLDGRWIYGYLADKNYINSPELEGEFLIDPYTICQYSDLTDMNKTKIFENDIVKDDSGDIGIVKFGLYNSKHYGFYIEWVTNSELRKDIYFWTTKRSIEVIGNVFDDAGLLKED